jgi:hypothetical protein
VENVAILAAIIMLLARRLNVVLLSSNMFFTNEPSIKIAIEKV